MCPTIAGTIVEARLHVLIDALVARFVELIDFLDQMLGHERALFETAAHLLRSPVCERSSWSCACYGASFCPSSSGPTAWSADGPRSNALHHHHADGRPGSWRYRERSDVFRDGVGGRLYRYWFSCSMLPSWPMVARQSNVDPAHFAGRHTHLRVLPSFAISCAETPAERTSLPPSPARNSML